MFAHQGGPAARSDLTLGRIPPKDSVIQGISRKQFGPNR